MLASWIRDFVRSLIRKVGYEIYPSGYPIRDWYYYLSIVKEEIYFNTVIDIGAAEGTMPLYETFPESKFVLVEPLEEYRPALDSLRDDLDLEYYIAAAGREVGQTTLQIGDDLHKSSTIREKLKGENPSEKRDVSVITIDDIVNQGGLASPFLIKIDVEGGEIDVLQGCTETLKEAELVILEVQVYDPCNDVPEIRSVLNKMHEYGFVMHDIIGTAYSGSCGNMIHIDVPFVKQDSDLRPLHGV